MARLQLRASDFKVLSPSRAAQARIDLNPFEIRSISNVFNLEISPRL